MSVRASVCSYQSYLVWVFHRQCTSSWCMRGFWHACGVHPTCTHHFICLVQTLQCDVCAKKIAPRKITQTFCRMQPAFFGQNCLFCLFSDHTPAPISCWCSKKELHMNRHAYITFILIGCCIIPSANHKASYNCTPHVRQTKKMVDLKTELEVYVTS